jgi:hypothetical protein
MTLAVVIDVYRSAGRVSEHHAGEARGHVEAKVWPQQTECDKLEQAVR